MDMVPHRLRFAALLLALGAAIAAWLLAAYFHRRLPEPRKSGGGGFNAQNAARDLRQLTGFGPRPAGSYANDVQAVTFLRDKLQRIAASLSTVNQLDIDTQKVSGSFQLEFLGYGFGQQYANLTNVVARLSAVGDGRQQRPALLVNAHFDSVPQGPGASDDGANCAVMLELARLLAADPKLLAHNDVILLFNGAEESILPAAHGFITQHPWASQVKAFINLEGAGSGGRELLFQSGPANPWLIHTFIKRAPHPFATVIGQEIFQSGIIPSDTDFRIFRDYGGIPGLDIAYVKDGYVYHTEYDTADRVPLATLQRVGDNILAVVSELSNMAELGPGESTSDPVFFDVFGLFMLSYPQWAGIIINVSLMVLSLVAITLDILRFSKKTDITRFTITKMFGVTVLSNLCVLLFALVLCLLIAMLLGWAGAALAWFKSPALLLPLYAAPTLLVCLLVLWLNKVLTSGLLRREAGYERLEGDDGLRQDRDLVDQRLVFHAAQVTACLPCLVLTAAGYNSGFIFSMSLAFNLCSWMLTSWDTKHCSWVSYLIYLAIQLVPLMMWSYMIQLVFIIFVPISGRKGATANPDILIGLATAVSTFILVQPLLPVFIAFSGKSLRKASLLLFGVFFLGLALMPRIQYSGDPANPAPKRMTLYHTRRSLNGVTDGGFLFVRSDYPDPSSLYDLVPEYEAAQPLSEAVCEAVIGCGVPVYTRKLETTAHAGGRWLSAEPPANMISNPVELQMSVSPALSGLSSDTAKESRRYNVSLEVSGPNWSLLTLAPRPGVSVLTWSLSQDLKPGADWLDRQTFFVNLIQGLSPGPVKLWLEVAVDENAGTGGSWLDGEMMDASVTGHHHHGQESRSPELEKIIAKFPDWVSLSAWTVDLAIYSL